jgi:hypothetical protein
MLREMTSFARLLLVLTGLAPIAVVQGAVEWGAGNRMSWIAAAACALILVVWAVALLRGVATSVAAIPKKIEAPNAKASEPLAFLVAYALPLVTTGNQPSSRLGLIAFAAMMGLVIWQEQLFQINPLLAILGYKFFSAKVENDAHILVLTRKRVLGSGVMPLVQISEYLWLDAETGNA